MHACFPPRLPGCLRRLCACERENTFDEQLGYKVLLLLPRLPLLLGGRRSGSFIAYGRQFAFLSLLLMSGMREEARSFQRERQRERENDKQEPRISYPGRRPQIISCITHPFLQLL